MSSRRSRPTLQGRRNLDAESHATSNVWSGAGFASGAYPFATPHASSARGETSAGRPGGRGTGISSRGTARTGWRRGSRRPRSEARQGQQWRLGSRSSGGRRPSGQAGRRTTLDGQPSGSTPRERPGTALGKGERKRAKSAASRARSTAEIGAMSPEGAPLSSFCAPSFSLSIGVKCLFLLFLMWHDPTILLDGDRFSTQQ